MTTTLVHMAKLHARADHGPAAAAVCSQKYQNELAPGETLSLTERVNCPDCRARLWWIEQHFDGTLHEHWPFPLDETAGETQSAA